VTESPSGAIIFCVVGAKMSEGINFSDDMARCVVVVGLPYPDRSDPELAQKMSYLDQQKGAHLVNVTSPGQEYYENLCMRAVNQSIGRSIRHIADYSAIILVDKRYISKRSITQKLPRWIADRIQHIDSFGAAVRQLRLFYAAREQSTREPNE
jgi:chromosome transmission fidelity protein 1